MTKLSDLGPPIPGERHDRDYADEHDNCYICPTCGQQVDMGDLRQVIWHERPKHKPLLLLVD
ncbi:MAG: hypothetical protein E5Y02_06515 [Mesorhizobium sp.]|nr:MAG: hypothetical protein E5Y06_30930 [Mesorhizobium sp.]TJU94248.1 MAG: hypothetical protein E5Y08_30905 [Mesorhizobium sp.]TJV13461.1 MAG: hypothetical protein E5Y07_31435 [Mesorhizobium sp.]TJV44808.1 MAG: hypothetical protein E5Y02_06515 [Mesorhizobium sp.]